MVVFAVHLEQYTMIAEHPPIVPCCCCLCLSSSSAGFSCIAIYFVTFAVCLDRAWTKAVASDCVCSSSIDRLFVLFCRLYIYTVLMVLRYCIAAFGESTLIFGQSKIPHCHRLGFVHLHYYCCFCLEHRMFVPIQDQLLDLCEWLMPSFADECRLL